MGHTSSTLAGGGTVDHTPGPAPRSYVKVAEESWPIVHSPAYTIKMTHRDFDFAKGTSVRQLIVMKKLLVDSQLVQPLEASEEELKRVHPATYFKDLKKGSTIMKLTGISASRFMPNFMVDRMFLRSFRVQTGGSILIGKLAMEHGWAINLGGGAHHCSAKEVGLACPYADITINIKYLQDNYPEVRKVMIIDLDVHQGNGYAKDFLGHSNIYILDIYNRSIYPQDEEAKRAISCKIELEDGVDDEEYLNQLQSYLEDAVEVFQPQYILYNAGVDILKGDPLGHFNVSPHGVIKRDEMVFTAARSRNIPIAMVTSGGFIRSAPSVVADSIEHLHKLGLIKGSKSNIVSSN